MKPSIIIADDHPLILKGLYDFLVEKEFDVVASAKNGKEALTLIKAHKPDIAVLDIQMPFFTGLEIAEQCKSQELATKIVLITFEKEEHIFNTAKSLGVYGYVLKEFALDEIENCIASVLENKPYFSPELIAYLEIDAPPENLDSLTESEQKILKLIAKNLTAKEIGELLHCSKRTVEKHKSNIIRKLNIESTQNSLLIWTKENQHYLI